MSGGDRDQEVLGAEESARLRRMPAGPGRSYAGAHAAVRRILGGYLDVAPQALEFGRRDCPRCGPAAHGAPVLRFPATDLEFSLSRSGPCWLLGVGTDGPLGVDLEHAAPPEPDGAAALSLTEGELRLMRAQPDPAARAEVFYRCWTRKEAVVKAAGLGLALDLRTVPVRPESERAAVELPGEPGAGGPWEVRQIDAAPGWYAAVARAGRAAGPVTRFGPPVGSANEAN